MSNRLQNLWRSFGLKVINGLANTSDYEISTAAFGPGPRQQLDWYRVADPRLTVLFFYGGMVFGVLPTTGFVSFESHLFGAIAGIVTAVFLERNRKLVTGTAAPRPSLEFGKSRRPWRFSLRRDKHR